MSLPETCHTTHQVHISDPAHTNQGKLGGCDSTASVEHVDRQAPGENLQITVDGKLAQLDEWRSPGWPCLRPLAPARTSTLECW